MRIGRWPVNFLFRVRVGSAAGKNAEQFADRSSDEHGRGSQSDAVAALSRERRRSNNDKNGNDNNNGRQCETRRHKISRLRAIITSLPAVLIILPTASSFSLKGKGDQQCVVSIFTRLHAVWQTTSLHREDYFCTAYCVVLLFILQCLITDI